ncbi:hypothetical protein C8R44DRAFT_952102, partial [Mycena epipterygia]
RPRAAVPSLSSTPPLGLWCFACPSVCPISSACLHPPPSSPPTHGLHLHVLISLHPCPPRSRPRPVASVDGLPSLPSFSPCLFAPSFSLPYLSIRSYSPHILLNPFSIPLSEPPVPSLLATCHCTPPLPSTPTLTATHALRDTSSRSRTSCGSPRLPGPSTAPIPSRCAQSHQDAPRLTHACTQDNAQPPTQAGLA